MVSIGLDAPDGEPSGIARGQGVPDAAALFESVVVHANDVVLVTEAEPIDAGSGGPRVIYANPAFTRMTGYEAHEIVGRTPRILQSPDTDRRELDRLRTALAAWQPIEVELLNRRKDGSEFWVQLNITPVADPTGCFTHWIAIQREITGRKRRELALQSILDSTTDLLLVLEDWRVTAVSAASLRILGHPPETLQGTASEELIHPADRRAVRELVARARGARPTARVTVTVRVRHVTGDWRWLDLTVSEVAGDARRLVLACADVTEQRRTQAALDEVNGRFRSAFDDAPIGMAITALSGRFLQVNTALTELLGLSADALLASTVRDITHHEDVQHTERQRQALTRGSLDRHRHETRFLHRDGSVVGILHSSSVVRDQEGRPTLLIDHIENITDRKAFEARLRHQALHDPLTGLPNRALFTDRLERALQSDSGAGRVAVLFCDVDRFKTVNDTYGHHIGDLVLSTIAQRLLSVVRPVDTVGRLGGDELVILCTDSGPAEATAMAGVLRDVLAQPIVVNGAAIAVTTSIGIALSVTGISTAEQLLRDSDDAMYAAKGSGRDQYRVHDEADGAANRHRLRLLADLPGALADGQLRVHFQPQVDLTTEEQVAREALVRWEHPELGLLLPNEFVGLAEEAGLMRDLGRSVLGAVLAEAAQRGDGAAEPMVTWVNASASELDDPDFAAGVEKALADHGMPGQVLGIEITESVLMTNLSQAHQNLMRLRALGVQLAIDDFGTGYSSLSYIGQFPVDTIKIDSSFVAGLDSPMRRRESFAVVTAVISLAHSLGLRVIAEGIETRTQALILHGLGCDQGQGYLYGKPQATAG
jgi:diguanylate cyclase (GGDEF)-like protein/PAS domain S-box-containing protein